jgi:N-methylhydantoinase A/oxoprolinase/acetone carboxylase beta subunit
MGMPACAGHELSGLYGLELRTVTGAINASILPISLRAADVVGDAAHRIAPEASLLVMRGDGGAADLATLRRRPLMTAFSGPAASVAGALRRLTLNDAIAIEVGGTSSNVALVRGGRPVLSYVRVLEHQTGVRSLDVRVVGVAGGSLMRVSRRLGRLRISDVGPRSAHIAGLSYATFSSPEVIEHSRAMLVSPKPGDAADYVVLAAPDGRTYAPTVTCAANALGLVSADAYAAGDKQAARAAFERVGELVGESWDRVAQRVLNLAAGKIAEVVEELVAAEKLRAPAVIGIGGGAGALVPTLATRLGLQHEIAPDAEVLSSIGDALSMVRVEIERGAAKPTPELIAQLHREAEAEAIAAGAAPESVQVESERIPERAAIRVTATGAVALRSGNMPAASAVALQRAAEHALGGTAELLASSAAYSLFVRSRSDHSDNQRFALVDSHSGISAVGRGRVMAGSGDELAAQLGETLPQIVKHIGPITVAPHVRIVRGPRVIDLGALSNVDEILTAALAECATAGSEPVIALIVKS